MICGYNKEEPEKNDPSKYRIKLIDFGLSKQKTHQHQSMNTGCGTIDFMAPEVLLSKKYDYGCDMWALGVIVFVMVSGQLPFWHEKDKVVQNKIKMIDYEFEGDVWNNVSKQCKDWIS